MKARILVLLFSLLPLTSTAEPFHFAWLTDTHIGVATAASELRQAVARINASTTIDFTIVSGDIAELDVNGYLDTAKVILDGLKKPYYIIPGNHDTKWSASGGQKFLALWGDDKFNFEYGGVRFIGIHQGPLLRMGAGYIVPEDLAWLKTSLAAMPDPRQPVILVTHYPIDESVSNWFEYLDIVKKYNVQAILHGHGHDDKIYNYEGIAGIMGRSSVSRTDRPAGFNTVAVYPDSAVFTTHTIATGESTTWFSLTFQNHTYPDTADYLRPDFSINTKYPQIRQIWNFNTGWAVASAPAVANSIVFITDSGNNVTALDQPSGEVIWQTRLGAPVYSTPEPVSDKVVVSSTDSCLYCLSAADGKPLWVFLSEAPIVASPVVAGNTVFYGGSDGFFRAIDIATGALNWEYQGIEGFVETKPLAYKNKILFGAWDGHLYALNAATGTLEWSWNDGRRGILYSPAACRPVVSKNKVFIVAPDRVMSCINLRNGKTIWREDRYTVRESIGISEDFKTVFAKTMRDTIVAYNSKGRKPSLKWAVHTGYGYDIDPCAPLEKDGTLFFGTKDGFVYALDASTGATKWIHRISVALVNNLVAIGGKSIIATAMDGSVTLLEME